MTSTLRLRPPTLTVAPVIAVYGVAAPGGPTIWQAAASFAGTTQVKATATGRATWSGAAVFNGSGRLNANATGGAAGPPPGAPVGNVVTRAGVQVTLRDGTAVTLRGGPDIANNVVNRAGVTVTLRDGTVVTTRSAGPTVWQGAAVFAGAGALVVDAARRTAIVWQGAAALAGSASAAFSASVPTRWSGAASFAGAGSLAVNITVPVTAFYVVTRASVGVTLRDGTQVTVRLPPPPTAWSGAAAFNGAGALTGDAVKPAPTVWSGAAAFVGVGTFSGNPVQPNQISLPIFVSAGALLATVNLNLGIATAPLHPAGAFAINATQFTPPKQLAGAALLAGTAALVASIGAVVRPIAAEFDGAAALAVSVAAREQIVGAFAPVSSLAATAIEPAMVAAPAPFSATAQLLAFPGVLGFDTTPPQFAGATLIAATAQTMAVGTLAPANGAFAVGTTYQTHQAAAAFGGWAMLNVQGTILGVPDEIVVKFPVVPSFAVATIQLQAAQILIPGAGSITATGSQIAFMSAAFGGAGGIASTFTAPYQGSATFAAAGALAATASTTFPLAAGLAGASILTGGVTVSQGLAASLTAAASLAASTATIFGGVTVLAGAGVVSAFAGLWQLIGAALAVRAAARAKDVEAQPVIAALNGAGQLVGATDIAPKYVRGRVTISDRFGWSLFPTDRVAGQVTPDDSPVKAATDAWRKKLGV